LDDNGPYVHVDAMSTAILQGDPGPALGFASDLPMEDVSDAVDTPRHLLDPTPLSPMERALLKKESSNYTTRIRRLFADVAKQETALRTELEKLTSSLTREGLADATTKLTALQTTLEKNKRSTPSLDKEKSSLIQKLNDLWARIDELTNILPPEDNVPRQYANGERLSQCSCSVGELMHRQTINFPLP
jgi:hypothetical protein